MNYDREMLEYIKALDGRAPGLALHSCCAVCSSSVLERLAGHFNITLVYYNPNIFPREEYELRKENQLRYIKARDWPRPLKYVDFDYEHGEFLAAARSLEKEPEGGARCLKCFELRLERTARYAAQQGLELLCSTLTLSPHKNAGAVNAAGRAAAEKHGLRWLPSDFKKRSGFLRSNELAKQYGIYRQDYCGCEFSFKKGES
ncbi:MAG: epoxyqueuosine reductase QueH [Oscillospiraceae bacterium]|nr:epoxyqueuosine reductase QueH [Oscillospiraceae bacterium]